MHDFRDGVWETDPPTKMFKTEVLRKWDFYNFYDNNCFKLGFEWNLLIPPDLPRNDKIIN